MRIADRLGAVRGFLAQSGYDACLVPRADEYLGEYIPERNERLRWLSGFTGSAGLAVVLRDTAAIFVDGRYTVQVSSEVPPDLFEYHHLLDEPLADWLASMLPAGSRVACDPRLHSLHWFRTAQKTLADAKVELVADTDNPVDCCWADRPAVVARPALLLGDNLTGESSLSKRQRIAAMLVERGCDAALLFAPDSISWLLNIRGMDMPQLPVVQSLAMLAADGSITLLIDARRLPPGFPEHAGEGVRVVPEENVVEVFAAYSGLRVLADAGAASAWVQLSLESAGATLVDAADPVQLPKARKNAVETEGSRRAHRRDAVAEIRFLAWLDAEVAAGRLHDEATLAERLYRERAQGDSFHACSFDTISAAGANAAMCHYNHLNGKPAALPIDSVYLVDSGGQYLDGTTDITRTVAIGKPGAEIRRLFTLVLKGHIALARVRFPRGTTGTQLDAFARQFLWREGFDYDHGTGHGVGVFLSVHEGPQRISKAVSTVPLLPGMIVSNEPGYYRDGAFGMRCENLQIVRESDIATGDGGMLEFETLSLVPFDTRLVAIDLLDDTEIAWLNDYHQRVMDEIGPLLAGCERDWLLETTQPLET